MARCSRAGRLAAALPHPAAVPGKRLSVAQDGGLCANLSQMGGRYRASSPAGHGGPGGRGRGVRKGRERQQRAFRVTAEGLPPGLWTGRRELACPSRPLGRTVRP